MNAVIWSFLSVLNLFNILWKRRYHSTSVPVASDNFAKLIKKDKFVFNYFLMAPVNKKSIILGLFITGFLFYSFYLYATLPKTSKFLTNNTERGKSTWQQYNCTACHQVYGLGGFLGPDLTNTYSKKGPEYIKAFLLKGTSVMPDFNLSDNEINSLLDYMKNIDASGNADPRSFIINRDGTIEQ